ncbi:F-actin-capping protein subunit alpha [Ascosphaera apis ARSEF 7405]|uniref:F-actin-capping protein subunit alpha n=1 Tax=Ascosphaera apis ARSEF 7405 TaxID=392613 RepID=A0A162ID82_9EURO|nr:F-actin-capping protein subunit alpha [Ascosphaera apis ARSEF 7405]
MASNVEIASSFIAGAPPGELSDVVNDIKALSDDPSLIPSLKPAFEKYNEEQLTTVKVPGGSQSVIVSAFNKLEDGRYYDAQSQTSFEFDHITQKASSPQTYVLESENLEFIKSLARTFENHAKEHYPSYTLGVYPTGDDSAVAIALVANKYSPHNFWNGRYRAIYTVNPSTGDITGSISVNVHYYEDGNVSLKSSKPVSLNAGSNPTSEAVVRKIAAAEKEQEEQLNEGFMSLSEGAFKGLRRQLPITRQKVEWEKVSGYRLGQDISGGKGSSRATDMADQPVKPAVIAAFPPPPPFWKHFTRENVERFEEFKKQQQEQLQQQQQQDGEDGQIDSKQAKDTFKKKGEVDLDTLRKNVPFELRYLVPPAVPKEEYQLFGEMQRVSLTLPSLASQGVHQIYPEGPSPPPAPPAPTAPTTTSPTDESPAYTPATIPPNPRFWLTATTKYLLLNFLELVGLLASNPIEATSKIQDIRDLFVNAHHLLNTYRPHQAREEVIRLMEEQLKKSREEIEEMEKVKVKVEEVLRGIVGEGQAIRDGDDEGVGREGEKKGRKKEVSSDDGLFEDDEDEEGEEAEEEVGRNEDGGVVGGDGGIGGGKAMVVEEWREMWEVLGSG